nr:MAG TPA: hypothetical protein [Caudoviricetes sp.]DAT08115.1 MAG TPA: hypothetical protein [Caudoviricetes sp.]DAV62539.1 MAG TPA: hypothetical protein [Caudoviricetes sp.]
MLNLWLIVDSFSWPLGYFYSRIIVNQIYKKK